MDGCPQQEHARRAASKCFIVAYPQQPEPLVAFDGELHCSDSAANAQEAQPQDPRPGGGGGIAAVKGTARWVARERRAVPPFPARRLHSERVVKQRVEFSRCRRQNFTTHRPNLFGLALRPTEIRAAACLERRLGRTPAAIARDPRTPLCRTYDRSRAKTSDSARER